MRNIMSSYKRIVVLCFFAIIVFFIDNRFVYALEEVNLVSIDSIYVDTSNVKKNYVEGVDFDSSNMEVYAYYNDGSVGEINNYNIINGINLQRNINSVVIRIDKFIVEIYVTVIPKDSVVTLSFKSKDIYDATLRKIRELEDILIDFNDEDMVISLYKDGLDISARNKTDTNKLIIQILGISKAIFLDSIFLSQNANTNLASLTPTARKERLEILTNTDFVINQFKEKLKDLQNEYEAKCVEVQLEKNKLEGVKQANLNQQADLQFLCLFLHRIY